MKLVDFQFEHLELLEWREEDRKVYNTGSEYVKALLTAEDKGVSYTVMQDGRIMVICGIVTQSQKTGYAFSLFSKYADGKSGIAVARLVKRLLLRAMEDMDLHRVTTYNLADAEGHHKWCEWLGFRWEGLVEKFDDEGNDYYQYGMVR